MYVSKQKVNNRKMSNEKEGQSVLMWRKLQTGCSVQCCRFCFYLLFKVYLYPIHLYILLSIISFLRYVTYIYIYLNNYP